MRILPCIDGSIVFVGASRSSPEGVRLLLFGDSMGIVDLRVARV